LTCIELDPSYIKGYYRAAVNFINLNSYNRANEILEKWENIKESKDSSEEISILKQFIISKIKEEDYNKNSTI